jgi:hypothetical protein
MYEINSHIRYSEHVKQFYCTHCQGLSMIEILLNLKKVLLLKPHFQHLKQFQFQNRELIVGVLRNKKVNLIFFHIMCKKKSACN